MSFGEWESSLLDTEDSRQFFSLKIYHFLVIPQEVLLCYELNFTENYLD